MCDKNCNKCGIAPLCTEKHSLCDTCLHLPLCPIQYTSVIDKCEIYKELPNPDISEEEMKKVLELIKKAPLKIEREEKTMESAERIEITFKSGETISYGKDEWDDYAYDGKAVIVKKNGAWVGIYNFDNVFCVELK